MIFGGTGIQTLILAIFTIGRDWEKEVRSIIHSNIDFGSFKDSYIDLIYHFVYRLKRLSRELEGGRNDQTTATHNQRL